MSAARPAACVIGYPAKHSRSPKLHSYWLEKYGIDGEYRAEETTHAGYESLLVKDKKQLDLGSFHHQLHHLFRVQLRQPAHALGHVVRHIA